MLSPTLTQHTSEPVEAAVLHAIVHHGSIPVPGALLLCSRTVVVAGKTFVWLDACGETFTAEYISGMLCRSGTILRCTRRAGPYFAAEPATNVSDAVRPLRSTKLQQVLALCAELGHVVHVGSEDTCERL